MIREDSSADRAAVQFQVRRIRVLLLRRRLRLHLKEMHKILSGESKCMLGIYLSGTGNTKYCVTKLVKLIDASADVVPLEDEFIIDKIKRNETVILGYPTQFSNAPYMVRDFI